MKLSIELSHSSSIPAIHCPIDVCASCQTAFCCFRIPFSLLVSARFRIIRRLLHEDIIEPSRLPWRAQVLVGERGKKKRLVIDYSTTINRYTALDAYPLPRIELLVNKIASGKYYSSIVLRSALCN